MLLMHYLFGATVGAIYGAYAERRQADGSGAASAPPFGSPPMRSRCPLLGLSDSTAGRPLELHLQSLAGEKRTAFDFRSKSVVVTGGLRGPALCCGGCVHR